MFSFLKGSAVPTKGLLSYDEAKMIIDAEVVRRGWSIYSDKRIRLQKQEGQPVWTCSGMLMHDRGSAMAINLDAKTGEITKALIVGGQ